MFKPSRIVHVNPNCKDATRCNPHGEEGEVTYMFKPSLWSRVMTCIIKDCHNSRDYQGHHIRPRGAGGSDGRWNRLGVCREHHTEIHQIGDRAFMEAHPETIPFIEQARKMEAVWQKMQRSSFDSEELDMEEKSFYLQILIEIRRWKKEPKQ